MQYRDSAVQWSKCKQLICWLPELGSNQHPQTNSPKPAAENLAPTEPREFDQIFAAHFQGMIAEPNSAE